MNKNIFAHPAIQLFGFSMILVGSPNFGGPFLLFVIGAALSGVTYGIVGLLAILCTLISLNKPWRKGMQLSGLLLMWVSLGICLCRAPSENRDITFGELEPVLTVSLFVAISIMILLQHFYYVQKDD